MNYITLYQVRQQLKLLNNTSTDTDLFNNWIQWSSDLIDWWKGRRFDIYQATYMLDLPVIDDRHFGDYYVGEFNPAERLTSNKREYLKVDKFDLLEVTELLNGNGEEIVASKYILEPIHLSGKNRIVLRSGNYWAPNSDGYTEQVISLTGFFGYNTNYPNCFVDTGEVISNDPGLLTSDTELNVGNILLPAKDFLAPKIQVGQMLRLKATVSNVTHVEFLLVENITAGDYDDYVVTVRRAFNGTTAYAFPKDTKIEVYRPDGEIVQAALRLVQWRYRQKDQDNFDKTYSLATQTVSTPTSLPSDVRTILGQRRAIL